MIAGYSDVEIFGFSEATIGISNPVLSIKSLTLETQALAKSIILSTPIESNLRLWEMSIKFGYTIPLSSMDEMIAEGLRAEKYGFDSIWFPDHLVASNPSLECPDT